MSLVSLTLSKNKAVNNKKLLRTYFGDKHGRCAAVNLGLLSDPDTISGTPELLL